MSVLRNGLKTTIAMMYAIFQPMNLMEEIAAQTLLPLIIVKTVSAMMIAHIMNRMFRNHLSL